MSSQTTARLLPAFGQIRSETRRLAIMIFVMTALMGVILSFLMTLRDQGMGADFLAAWGARFVSTYLMVVPVVLVVSPLARRITDAIEGSFAASSASDASAPPADPVIRDSTQYWGEAAGKVDGPVMLVNLFTPKAGKTDEFVRTQSAEYVRLAGMVDGFIANRLGRAIDGSDRIVNVALFQDIESYKRWRESKLFAEHMDIIRPLVETSAPGIYTVAYDSHHL